MVAGGSLGSVYFIFGGPPKTARGPLALPKALSAEKRVKTGVDTV
ncbi:MAG: hypothetical protein ACI8QI_000607 [Limisphaerales bacterium]